MTEQFDVHTEKSPWVLKQTLASVRDGKSLSLLNEQQEQALRNADDIDVEKVDTDGSSIPTYTFRVTCVSDSDDESDADGRDVGEPHSWFDGVAGRITDRGDTHEDSFGEIAQLWSTYLNTDVSQSDVANLMVLLKVARNANGVYEDDNYIDIAGYAYWGDRKEQQEK